MTLTAAIKGVAQLPALTVVLSACCLGLP
ncbi:hypothetical protein J1605_003232 [Eschrichtius robustus]|uniref:Uncharacterized protein n=1 Tax=Eschrichtius robustus TaxID=9764 RepID=A0AB34HT04_ESCRO|nr:hypothetical protein J1605_003232 [Eschrichtius robustus]